MSVDKTQWVFFPQQFLEHQCNHPHVLSSAELLFLRVTHPHGYRGPRCSIQHLMVTKTSGGWNSVVDQAKLLKLPAVEPYAEVMVQLPQAVPTSEVCY